ncbi:MAG: RHS repeat-associated core domain-containing protein [Anaerolineae bacterium]|nr:RHS repeat-associated core domain-containing protein [Anaerolineae bacterium]
MKATTQTELSYNTVPTGRFAMRESILRIALMEFSQREHSHLSGGSRSFDHLQSSSVILDEGGDVISRTTYTAFGEVRGTTGTSPTDYTESKRSFDFKVKTVTVFTRTHGQRSYMDELGLMYYVARWYDPYLNQFIQPDSLIPQPGNSGDWDRYAYVLWNPVRYNDPSGHEYYNPTDQDPLIDGDYLPGEFLVKTAIESNDISFLCEIGNYDSFYVNTSSLTESFYLSIPNPAGIHIDDGGVSGPDYIDYGVSDLSVVAGIFELLNILYEQIQPFLISVSLKNSTDDLFVTLTYSMYSDKMTLDNFSINNQSNQNVTRFDYEAIVNNDSFIVSNKHFVSLEPGTTHIEKLNFSFPNDVNINFNIQLYHDPTFMYEKQWSLAAFNITGSCLP